MVRDIRVADEYSPQSTRADSVRQFATNRQADPDRLNGKRHDAHPQHEFERVDPPPPPPLPTGAERAREVHRARTPEGMTLQTEMPGNETSRRLTSTTPITPTALHQNSTAQGVVARRHGMKLPRSPWQDSRRTPRTNDPNSPWRSSGPQPLRCSSTATYNYEDSVFSTRSSKPLRARRMPTERESEVPSGQRREVALMHTRTPVNGIRGGRLTGMTGASKFWSDVRRRGAARNRIRKPRLSAVWTDYIAKGKRANQNFHGRNAAFRAMALGHRANYRHAPA